MNGDHEPGDQAEVPVPLEPALLPFSGTWHNLR